MAPKRRLRRPGAANPPGRVRRPAARVEVPRGGMPPPIELCDLSLAELRQLGFVKIGQATYYGQMVSVAGSVVGASLEGDQLFLELHVSGTTDEKLLQAVSQTPDRRLKVHVCSALCDRRLTGERLIHADRVAKVDRASEDWLTNVELVVPEEHPADEMAILRGALEEVKGVESAPNAKEKKRKKKKEKKAKAEAEDKAKALVVDDKGERGEMPLHGLFRGTGLDPEVKPRRKLLRKARALNQSSKKKKKKHSSSSSGDGSSSSSSSSSSGTLTGEGLFDSEKKLLVIWKRYPGALACQALLETKQRLMTQAGTMWHEEKSSLPPVFTHYCRQSLLASMAPVMGQEAMTVSTTLDLMLQGKAAQACDVLAQRLKSLEALSKGAHWAVGRQLELVRLDAGGIAESAESLEAARRAREEDKLKNYMTKPSGGRYGESQPSSGGKGKKGKDKHSGKGKGEETGKSKGADGPKKDEAWRKK